MINPERLRVSECYFFVHFCEADRGLKYPNIETLIYVGRNLVDTEKDSDKWFFQDTESYLTHGSFLQLPEGIEREVVVIRQDSLATIYDIEGLIVCLEKVKKGILAKTGI